MFFVLRRKDDGLLLRSTAQDGQPRYTRHLNEAKLFCLKAEVDHLMNQQDKVTTGGLTCEVKGDQIPPSLPGTWEIALVDLRLA